MPMKVVHLQKGDNTIVAVSASRNSDVTLSTPNLDIVVEGIKHT